MPHLLAGIRERLDLGWLGVAALVQCASLRALDKHVLHHRGASLAVAAVAALASCWVVRELERGRLSRLARRYASPGLLVVGLLLVGLVLVAYPVVDGRKAQGAGSDADDALIVGARNLYMHLDPYRESTYLGNPLSPGPGWIALAAPFVALGAYPLLNPFWLAALAVGLRRTSVPPVALAGAALVLFAGLGLWEVLVSGADLLALGAALALCVHRVACARRGRAATFLTVLILALVLTGRVVLPVMLPAIGLWLYRHRGAVVAWRIAGGAALVTSGMHLAFWARSTEYMPLHVLGQGLALGRRLGGSAVSGSALLVALAIAIVLLWRERRGLVARLAPAGAQGLARAAAVSLSLPLYVVALGDLAVKRFVLAEWEVNYLMVTLPLWIYHALVRRAGPRDPPPIGVSSVTQRSGSPGE